MKYKHSYWIILKPFIKKYLRMNFDKNSTKIIFKKAKAEYKHLISKAEDIGYNNPMASNLYFSLLFVSFLTSNRDKFTEDMLAEMIESILNSSFAKKIYRVDLNKEKDMERLKKRIRKNAEWAEKNRTKYPENWDYNFEGRYKDGCYYYFTKCPIAKFFKENNLENLTYIFCDTDYISFRNIKGRLIRQCTLAKGDDKCDFWIVGDRVKNPH
ncbi:MAG: L-2-amino-thiazoline-4-carboxylic acid hydrolase [Christensenellaceae bacterium]|nr:L-2-amino-thiazoline-4-carboxylic acid hydrolase [Christensenellaceae bacterium]